MKRLIIKDMNTKGQFTSWAKKYLYNEKRKADDLIVLAYEMNDDDFKLLYSTKSLLKNIILQASTGDPFFACDTTHKIHSCNFKLTLFATTTIDHNVSDIAYLVHMHEDAAAFEYGLREIKDCLKKNFSFDWTPKVLLFLFFIISKYCMSDYHLGIAKAVKKLFPKIIHGKCYFHLVHNVQSKFPKQYDVLKEYIYQLTLCSNSSELDKLWKLISAGLRKNKDTKSFADSFISYFEKAYLNKENRYFFSSA